MVPEVGQMLFCGRATECSHTPQMRVRCDARDRSPCWSSGHHVATRDPGPVHDVIQRPGRMYVPSGLHTVFLPPTILPSTQVLCDFAKLSTTSGLTAAKTKANKTMIAPTREPISAAGLDSTWSEVLPPPRTPMMPLVGSGGSCMTATAVRSSCLTCGAQIRSAGEVQAEIEAARKAVAAGGQARTPPKTEHPEPWGPQGGPVVVGQVACDSALLPPATTHHRRGHRHPRH